MNQTACSILFCVLSCQRDLVGMSLKQTKCAPCTLPKIRTPLLLCSSPVKFHIMKLNGVFYSIAEVKCSVVKLGAVQCSACLLSAVQCSAVCSCVVQCSAVQCSAVQCSVFMCSAALV